MKLSAGEYATFKRCIQVGPGAMGRCNIQVCGRGGSILGRFLHKNESLAAYQRVLKNVQSDVVTPTVRSNFGPNLPTGS